METKKLLLAIDLVPQSVWGQSLANVLRRREWDNIRNEVYSNAGYTCEICSARSERLHCHEIWRYDWAEEYDVPTQVLVELQALCEMCHLVKHIGFARTNKGVEYEDVVHHFMKVNQVDKETFLAHHSEALRLFDERSQMAWITDYGSYEDLV